MKKNVCLRLIPLICTTFLLLGCENDNSTQSNQAPTTAETTAPTIATQDKDLQFDKTYYVENSVPFIKLTGFSNDEPGPGVWTDGNSATFILYVDPQLLQTHPTGNIKFMIRPFLAKDLQTQNISFNWGEDHTQSYAVSSEQWISLPYTATDWQDSQDSADKQITIQISLPDAVAPKQLSVGEDARILGLRFVQFTLSN